MKTKVTDELLQSSTEESQSEDDEDGWMVTDEVEKEFYKTLSQIKNKDPEIYKNDVEFFQNVPKCEKKEGKKKKSTPLTLRDYERKLILEKRGELSDEEPPESTLGKDNQPTYVEEQESLKKGFKSMLNDESEDENEGSWGGLFKKREKTVAEKEEEDEHYKDWLKGKKNCASDGDVEKEMKPLRDYWTDPNLDKEEQFLRDYVLNKKFLDNDEDKEEMINNKVLLENDEDDDEDEDKDEDVHNCNHRFEEPDQEFIKRYPRVMENSVRRKDDHRKQTRDKVKERKLKEKEKKKAEIRLKKKLKKKEIEAKLEELKILTGNDKLAFENVLNQDFDLDEHDKAMQHLFNEEFYSKDDPDFRPTESTGYDEEPWEEGHYEDTENVPEHSEPLHCEDPNFNMDCDYDPSLAKPKTKDSRSRRRKDKHRRTTVSEAVSREKPKFDPTVHQSFKEYLDEYYAIDCEDFIGELPCRFKYRRTVPNSYGLTIDEILAADEKELDRWCSIKKIHQLRPEYKEKCDVKVYKKKAADERLKRKVLPSLFKHEKEEEAEKTSIANVTTPNEEEIVIKHTTDKKKQSKQDIVTDKASDANFNTEKNKLKSNHNKNKTDTVIKLGQKDNSRNKTLKRKMKDVTSVDNHKRRKNKDNEKSQYRKNQESKSNAQDANLIEMSDARLLAYGLKPKKFRNKLKYKKNS